MLLPCHVPERLPLCVGLLLLLKLPGVLSDLTKNIVNLHISSVDIECLSVLVGDRDGGRF